MATNKAESIKEALKGGGVRRHITNIRKQIIYLLASTVEKPA